MKEQPKKKFIKLNNNDNNLSLGNLCRYIKEIAVNKVFASQTEVFCTIFNVDNVSDSTVNNYCIGYRAIGSDYKDIYYNYQKKIIKNKLVLIDNILNLVSILDGRIYENDKNALEIINNSDNLKKLISALYNLAKNDATVRNEFTINIKKLIDNSDLYTCICDFLFYIILEKKQPIYIDNMVKDVIENILNKTNISINDLESFLNAQFMDGINYIYSIKKMASVNNPYAAFELGMMEYKGEITGVPRFNKCYEYMQKAALSNHPRANFMIASLIYNKKIGNLSKEDLNTAWYHLNIAKTAGSVAAINAMGLAYLKGYVPNVDANVNKAIELFTEASNYNYAYAYNNLGKIYEEKKDFTKAFTYYLKSADIEESWACNKIGNYYRLGFGCEKDLAKAFTYYNKALNGTINTLEKWCKYNLAKYFYLTGCYEAKVEKDVELAIKLLKEIAPTILEASIELMYIYSSYYLKTQDEKYIKEINYYQKLCETNPNFNHEIKEEINRNLKLIKENKINIDIIIKQGS